MTGSGSEGAAGRRRWAWRGAEGGRRGIVSIVFVVGLLLGCFGVAESSEPPTSIEPRPTMTLVFQEMKKLIPLSLDEARWSDPAERAGVMASLERLEYAAMALGEHGRSREAGFDELALNLGRDLRQVSEHYRIGAYDEARFFLTGSLQTCVACHTRLPSDNSFGFANQLTDQVEIKALDPRERAWLYVTVRRFDDALDVWERLLRDPDQRPGQLDASGVIVDYLNVALRVRTDIPRARRELTMLSARDDLPVYLRHRVGAWRKAIEALDAKRFDPKREPSLELGASLAEEAGAIDRGSYGRDGLVQDLAAASQLVRWLEADRARRQSVTRNRTQEERRATAKAYFWLGVVEGRSLDGFWVNLAERHLEASIRSDPRGPYAERAYAKLEETQVLGFGGASGDVLPADVWTNLKELRELMGLEPAAR